MRNNVGPAHVSFYMEQFYVYIKVELYFHCCADSVPRAFQHGTVSSGTLRMYFNLAFSCCPSHVYFNEEPYSVRYNVELRACILTYYKAFSCCPSHVHS